MTGSNGQFGPRAVLKFQEIAHVRRHFMVTVSPNTSLAAVHEDPTALRGQKLSKGDLVSLISHDGSTLYDSCVVRSVEGGVYLGKPLRIETFEESALYSDGRYRVVPVGNEYGVEDIRLGTMGPATFTTARAAEQDIHRKYPKTA